MLLELNIRDFAIIDRLNIQFDPGFNVLTGETGAGKSIIIDALGTLRGEKADPTFVRAGSNVARVEGIFSLDDCADVLPVLQEYGLLDDGDDQVIVAREINAATGRSVARINNRAVNSATLLMPLCKVTVWNSALEWPHVYPALWRFAMELKQSNLVSN